jgi:uncharacterized protein
MKKIFITFSLFLLPLSLFAYSSIGSFKGPVTDLANVITPEQEISLTQELSAFKQQTSSEIAVVTIPSLEGDTVENFAEKLFKEWGIGTEKNDNGVLLLVAIEDRTLRIEVGYGLEGALTDITSSQIIKNDITPRFKQGDYYGGIAAGVQKIMDVTRGEYVATKEFQNGTDGVNNIFNPSFIEFWVGFLWCLVAIFAATKSWWLGGVVGGGLGLFGSLFYQPFGVLSYLLFFFIGIIGGLLVDFIVSKHSAFIFGGRGGRGGWGGGFGGGGGWGGGGMSGGGGSSGRW